MPSTIKVVSIIGPLRNPDPLVRAENIRLAMAMREVIFAMGAMPWCPHSACGDLDGLVPDEVVMPALLEMCCRGDVGYLLQGWRQSAGSLDERAAMQALGKPVFESLAELKDWLKRID